MSTIQKKVNLAANAFSFSFVYLYIQCIYFYWNLVKLEWFHGNILFIFVVLTVYLCYRAIDRQNKYLTREKRNDKRNMKRVNSFGVNFLVHWSRMRKWKMCCSMKLIVWNSKFCILSAYRFSSILTLIQWKIEFDEHLMCRFYYRNIFFSFFFSSYKCKWICLLLPNFI